MSFNNKDIIPFTVPDLTIEQKNVLQEKLSQLIFPNELKTDVGWEYGE